MNFVIKKLFTIYLFILGRLMGNKNIWKFSLIQFQFINILLYNVEMSLV
jgi:hypothetical protein